VAHEWRVVVLEMENVGELGWVPGDGGWSG